MGLGGAERVVVGLATGLRDRGHEVAVSGAPGTLDAELPDAVRRLTLPERGRSPAGVLEWSPRQAAFVRSFRPHVVHAHNTKATVAAAAAVRLARGPRRPPVLATHHGRAERTGRQRRGCCARGRRRSSACPRTLPCPAARRDPQRRLAAAAARRVAGRRAARAVRRPARRRSRTRSASCDVAALVDGARFMVVGDGALRARSTRYPASTFLGRPRGRARADGAAPSCCSCPRTPRGSRSRCWRRCPPARRWSRRRCPGCAICSAAEPGVIAADFTPDALATAVRELLRRPGATDGDGSNGRGARARALLGRCTWSDAYARATSPSPLPSLDR